MGNCEHGKIRDNKGSGTIATKGMVGAIVLGYKRRVYNTMENCRYDIGSKQLNWKPNLGVSR